jgi:hypothetical protein
MMMKSAQDTPRDNLGGPLDWPIAGRIVAQGRMRSEVVVIACVGRKDPVEMGFAEDDLWPAERGSNLRRSLTPFNMILEARP